MSQPPTTLAPNAKNRFRSRRLSACAAAVATTSAAGEAAASVITDLTPYSTGGGTNMISLDGTAFGEIELLVEVNMMGEISLSLDSPNAAMMGDSSTVEFAFFSSGMMSPDYLDPLSAGQTVDGSLTFSPEAFVIDQDSQNPNWAVGDTAFVGFQFDDPTGSFQLYGFAQLTFDSGTTFSIDQVAFEDSGAPITIMSVPEASTALLMGLGLALFARSRRRWHPRLPSARRDHG